MKESILTIALAALLSIPYPFSLAEFEANKTSSQLELSVNTMDITAAASVLVVPDEITVYVDGSTSFQVVIQSTSEEELTLAENERIIAEFDDSIARAEVSGQTIYLVGVQSGIMELTLRLQRKNAEDVFEDVNVETDGASRTVNATIHVNAI